MKLNYKTTAIATALVLGLTGCQTVAKKPVTQPVATVNANTTTTPTTTTPTTNNQTATNTVTTPAIPKQFVINGKIGVTTPQQTGSAFYTWAQQGSNFGIDIAGALNAGQTTIHYNGQTATLTNEQGTLNAESPEELLFKATKWQAPISQLPYWIMGQAAPSDSDNQMDSQNRLTTAHNGDWTADFTYNNNDKLPSRINMRHPQGYKVVMTINRLS